ncbi:unnamed protein product [Camellia sinensis]
MGIYIELKRIIEHQNGNPLNYNENRNHKAPTSLLQINNFETKFIVAQLQTSCINDIDVTLQLKHP